MPTTFFLLFGLMELGFAVFTYFMFDFFILSNYRNAKRCTEKTEGVIIRYSYALYNGISLPVVEYTVNGEKYNVVGVLKGSNTRSSGQNFKGLFQIPSVLP